jgi:hypothetical protein
MVSKKETLIGNILEHQAVAAESSDNTDNRG